MAREGSTAAKYSIASESSLKFFLSNQPMLLMGGSWSRWESPRGVLAPRMWFYILLGTLFALSFCVPVFVAARLGGFFESRPVALNADSIVPEAFSVEPKGSLVNVSEGPGLDVVAEKDFLFISWYQFRQVPISGDSMVLTAKFPEGKRPRSGYGIGLTDDRGILRPMVYWATKNEGGRWYKFSEFEVPAKTWVMFAISLREGKYLGVHAAAITEKGKADIKLLGGYELPSETVGSPDRPIQLAFDNKSKYVSKVGPIGVFQLSDLTEKLREILKEAARNPVELPSSISNNDIGLWVPDGRADRSQFNHKVTVNVEKR